MTTTLLAVDDSKTMRKVLEITFAGEDFRTVLAGSGQEALAKLRAERPKLALVDVTLDDINGYDLCQQIKSEHPEVGVIVLSSKQQPYDKGRGTAAGADDFMDKPFDTQKLLEKVQAVLSAPRTAPAAGQRPQSPQVPAQSMAARPQDGSRIRANTLSYGASAPAGQPAPRPPAPASPPAAQSRTLPGTPRPASVQPIRPAAIKPAASPQTPPAAAAPPAAARVSASGPAAKPVAAAVPAAAAAAAPAAAAAASAAVSNGGALAGKLEGLGLSPDQVQAVLSLSREVVEQVVWEVVPVLAEALIKEEIHRLTRE